MINIHSRPPAHSEAEQEAISAAVNLVASATAVEKNSVIDSTRVNYQPSY